MEVAKTVMEVADVAWTAVECSHHFHGHHDHDNKSVDDQKETKPVATEEVESLKLENRRLRNLLEQNLKLLQNLSESPCLMNDCPPDVCNCRLDILNHFNSVSILNWCNLI